MLDLLAALSLFLLPALSYLAGSLFSNKGLSKAFLQTSTECGLSSHKFTISPTGVQFYLVALLFLLFDLEVCLLIPAIVSSMASMAIFILLLLICTIYETQLNSVIWC